MTRFASSLFALLLAASMPLVARAQNELPWRLRDEPRVTRAELEEFLRAQEIESSDQAIILRSAHDDLVAAYAEMAQLRAAERERVQQLQREWYAANPPTPERLVRQPSFSDQGLRQRMHERRAEVEASFEETIVALLPEVHMNAWEHLKAAKNRQHVFEELYGMPGRRGGSQPYFDLIIVSRDANLAPDDAAAIATILSHYEASMVDTVDRLLERENELISAFEENAVGAGDANSPEIEARRRRMQAAATELQSLREALLAVNDRFRPEIEAALSPAGQRKFDRAIKQQMFPAVYMADPVELAVDGLREWSGLATSLRGDVDAIWDDYETRREAILDRLIDAQQRWDAPANEEVRREYQQKIGEIMQARQEGRPIDQIEPEETPPFMLEPLQQRHELALATLRRLGAIFPADERGNLPAHVRLCLDLAAQQ